MSFFSSGPPASSGGFWGLELQGKSLNAADDRVLGFLGFRVEGLGFGVWGLGFRVWGLGFRVYP